MKKKTSDTNTLGTKHVPSEPRNQYVYCPDRKGSPHVAIAVCRSDKCGKYAACRAGGLDEIETKAARGSRQSALSRILEGDDL